jgi:hypothetical protein
VDEAINPFTVVWQTLRRLPASGSPSWGKTGENFIDRPLFLNKNQQKIAKFNDYIDDIPGAFSKHFSSPSFHVSPRTSITVLAHSGTSSSFCAHLLCLSMDDRPTFRLEYLGSHA